MAMPNHNLLNKDLSLKADVSGSADLLKYDFDDDEPGYEKMED